MRVNTIVTRTDLRGFTLVELLVVVSIIAILLSGAVMVGQYVTTNAKIQKTKSVLSALNTAMNEYQQYHAKTNPEFPWGDGTPPSIPPLLGNPPMNGVAPPGNDINDPAFAFGGIARLHFALEQVPSCLETLNRIPENNKSWYTFPVGPATVSYKIYVDAWMNEDISQMNWLRYEYAQGSGNFPVIRSAGPDLVYGTADDILSTEIDG